MDKVATGEHWFGQQALELQLVDELATSDDIILEKNESKVCYFSEIQSEKATFTKNR